MQAAERSVLVQRALALEWLTVAWMSIEALVAIVSGVSASSLTLVAFGVDSIIELISAILLLWRLNVELRQGDEFSERAERRAARIGGVLLLALSLFLLVGAGWSLWEGEGQEFSIPGLVVAVLALPLMYWLARTKLRVADGIGSAALRADAIEAVACSYLSAVVVIGLLAQLIADAWWIDAATSLCLIPFLLREAREAWEGSETS
jgi:divalent metal cation (Fe/Co/Zn/Cd) transporter